MGFLVNDPLEQFNLVLLSKSLKYYSCTLSNMTLTFSIIFFVLILSILILNKNSLFSWVIVIFNILFDFIKNILKNNLNIKTHILLPFLFFNFLFILFSNLIGMVPYSFTVTSHFTVTFFLSLSFFVGLNIIGVLYNGVKFINLFLPQSTPLLLSPLLFVLEFISYSVRVFSLAIRLFANMTAGHALMKILSSFCWTFISFCSILTVLISLIPFLLIFCIIGLEFLIAFLQAYVFFMLSVIYINDIVNLH